MVSVHIVQTLTLEDVLKLRRDYFKLESGMLLDNISSCIITDSGLFQKCVYFLLEHKSVQLQ